MFLVVNEPEEQGFPLKKSKFHQILGACWDFFQLSGFFSWPTTKTNGKTRKPEEQEFSLKKSKFLQILGSGWRLYEIFSSF
jgi:hypothetical protein